MEVYAKSPAMPATSVRFQRLLSKLGKIATEIRASLKPHNVEMLVFLARNLN